MNVQDYLRNNGIIWSNLAYFLSLDAHEKNLPSKKVFIFSYISGNGNGISGKGNPKNTSYISGNGNPRKLFYISGSNFLNFEPL